MPWNTSSKMYLRIVAARYARKCTPNWSAGRFLREKFGKGLLPLGESTFHLPADEQRVRDCADDTETDFIIYDVPDQRSRHISASFRQEFMEMMPALEW